MMSDLRESSNIQQDSDIVMFMLRREYYDPMGQTRGWRRSCR